MLMRRILFLTLFCLNCIAVSMAQTTPKAEISGGFALISSFDQLDEPFWASNDLKGWHVSATGNVNPWFGMTAEVSGTKRGSDLGIISTDNSLYYVHVGPRFSYRKKERITPFGHLLVGLAHKRSNMSDALTSSSISSSETGFSGGLGAGIDININRSVAVRAAQLDLFADRDRWVDLSGTRRNSYDIRSRFSFGLVWRIGSKE
jgi:hypothetical protein